MRPRKNFTVRIVIHEDGVLVDSVNRIFTATTNLQAMGLAIRWTDTYMEIECGHCIGKLKATIKII